MNPSDASVDRARALLEYVRWSLSDAHLAAVIDQPIDRAVATFRCPDETIQSQRAFLDCVAGFLRHIYARAFPWGRQPAWSQARDEAVSLLESRDVLGGYNAALRESCGAEGAGISAVLTEFVVALKAQMRADYAQRLLSVHLGSLDWASKCHLASLILQRSTTHEFTEVSPKESERWAHFLPGLIKQDLRLNPIETPLPSTASPEIRR